MSVSLSTDDMAEYEILDKLITHQSGDKSQRLTTVCKLVGPRLSWQDWYKLEKLNKIIRKWCHSEDAAIGLFGLWQKRTMSLYEVERRLRLKGFRYGFNFESARPFVEFFSPLIAHKLLYRSLLELSDLEKKNGGKYLLHKWLC